MIFKYPLSAEILGNESVHEGREEWTTEECFFPTKLLVGAEISYVPLHAS